MAEYLFGLKTKDFVLLAADRSVLQYGALNLKQDEGKFYELGSKNLMLCVGDGGDAYQFAEYIEKNVQLYKMRNGYELSPHAAAAFTRRTLADALRSSSPYLVYLILGGYDQHTGPYLSYMDYLATEFQGDYVMHGFGGRFCYSILDRIYRANFTEAEALTALKICITEVKKRFALQLPNFSVHIVDKNGIRQLPDLSPEAS